VKHSEIPPAGNGWLPSVRRAMFIEMTLRDPLTPSGVKCNDVISGAWNS
jgi:hypothetical protein